jgi:hypothetical protein
MCETFGQRRTHCPSIVLEWRSAHYGFGCATALVEADAFPLQGDVVIMVGSPYSWKVLATLNLRHCCRSPPPSFSSAQRPP